MSIEIEKRFRKFDKEEIEEKLKEMGFRKKGNFLFQVITFHGTKPNQLIRVRDEGFRITLVIKQKRPRPGPGNAKKNTNAKAEANYEKEWEVEVNDFEKTIEILLELGLKKKNVTEKIREIYQRVGDGPACEVIFDHYPGLPPFMEIECEKEGDLKKIVKEMGLDETERQNFGIWELYQNLYKNKNINQNKSKNKTRDVLTFRSIFTIDPNRNIKSNKAVFEQTIQKQKEMLNAIAVSRNRRSRLTKTRKTQKTRKTRKTRKTQKTNKK